ncbi:hypothetical protein Ga0100231_005225 [Opitutaceae bacterium TAV4]|uniref:hypothetical protein n=1 Tax=Geminisphaera colitermitum TaxID=1148786 RepID=UPI0005B76F89|nr:hypothetical protein [Geminisphaera colitermitum]RRJ97861.1 hypothetical protein Ga0100231_005225 [Opitutaceae bacterium TAV4]RRK02390.1 hypothetical protein Ga0100230_004345 [Opitutaceae bacterium TAV3]
MAFFDETGVAAFAVDDLPGGGGQGNDVGTEGVEFGEKLVAQCFGGKRVVGVGVHATMHEVFYRFDHWNWEHL